MLPCLSRLSLTSGCAGEEAATGTPEGDLDALRAHLFQTAVLDRLDEKAKKDFNKLATDAITVDDIMRMVGTLQSPGVSEIKETKDQLGGVDRVPPWHRLRLKIEMATILLENLKRVRATTPDDGTTMTSNFYLLSAILASKQADDPNKQNERARRTREVAQAESAAARRKLGQVPAPGSLPTPVKNILAQTGTDFEDSPACFMDTKRGVILRSPITLRDLRQLPEEDQERYTPMYITMDDTLLNYYLTEDGRSGLLRIKCFKEQTGAPLHMPVLPAQTAGPAEDDDFDFEDAPMRSGCFYDPSSGVTLRSPITGMELDRLLPEHSRRYDMMWRSMDDRLLNFYIKDIRGLEPTECPPPPEPVQEALADSLPRTCLYDSVTEEFLPEGVTSAELAALSETSQRRYRLVYSSWDVEGGVWDLEDETGLEPRPCPPDQTGAPLVNSGPKMRLYDPETDKFLPAQTAGDLDDEHEEDMGEMKQILYDPETKVFLPEYVNSAQLDAMSERDQRRYNMMYSGWDLEGGMWELDDREGLRRPKRCGWKDPETDQILKGSVEYDELSNMTERNKRRYQPMWRSLDPYDNIYNMHDTDGLKQFWC